MAICKKEFSDRMAENGDITKKAALQATELFMETVRDFLVDGERIMLTGFGSFEMRPVKEKKARNPHTGEPCIVPEHMCVLFRPSDELAAWVMEMRKEMDTDGMQG